MSLLQLTDRCPWLYPPSVSLGIKPMTCSPREVYAPLVFHWVFLFCHWGQWQFLTTFSWRGVHLDSYAVKEVWSPRQWLYFSQLEWRAILLALKAWEAELFPGCLLIHPGHHSFLWYLNKRSRKSYPYWKVMLICQCVIDTASLSEQLPFPRMGMLTRCPNCLSSSFVKLEV